MKLTTRDRKALDLVKDSPKDGRRISTSQRHARFAVHPSTAYRLVRLGLVRTSEQRSVSLYEPVRRYLHLTEAGAEALASC